MNSIPKFVLLVLCAIHCHAKSDKRPPPVSPPVSPPTPVQIPAVTRKPTQSPVRPPVTAPVAAPLFLEMDLETFYLNFESIDGSPVVVKEDLLVDLSEEYLEDFILALDHNNPVKKTFVELNIKAELSNARRNMRRLQGTGGINAEIGGTITFLKDGAPDASLVKDVQQKAFSDPNFITRVENVFGASALVKSSIESPAIEGGNTAGDATTIGGKNTGGTVGGVVGAFAVVGVVAFVFVQYKRRKMAHKENRAYIAPEVQVEAGMNDDGEPNFEAVMSPTFSIQESVTTDNSAVKRGFKMPIGTKVKSFSTRKSGMSVTGHDEYDAYSLDGSTALGQKPNLGEQMLGQVLAMNDYVPTSDDKSMMDTTSPGRPRMIRVGSRDSLYSFHHDCSFDSPSVTGGVSLSGNSMMNESITAHGRTLMIGDRQSIAQLKSRSVNDRLDDDSSGDGIEVAIDRECHADTPHVSKDIDGIQETLSTPTRTPPGQSTSSFTPARQLLNFSLMSSSKESYKVNIVETEQAQNSKTDGRNIDPKPKFPKGVNRQVQRVEENHKVTITTEASNPTLVRSSFPIQSARNQELIGPSKDDDDSYSSYYSSEDEQEAISTLLRNAREQVHRQNSSKNNTSSSSRINPVQSRVVKERLPDKDKQAMMNQSFPLRIAQQYPTNRNTSKPSSMDAFHAASSKKKEIEHTIKAKGISTTNYAAEARRNRMARKAVSGNGFRNRDDDEQPVAKQISSLRKARLQQSARL